MRTIALILFLVIAASAYAEQVVGKVVGITDGDTLPNGVDRVIAINYVDSKGGLKGIEAIFYIQSKCNIIWDALIDYPNYGQIFAGNLRPPRVISEDSDGAKVEFWVDARLTHINFVLYRSYDEYCQSISWHKVAGDGNPSKIEGEWRIQESGIFGESLVTYRSFVKVKFVPMAISRRLARAATLNMAIRFREWVEANNKPFLR